jgi:uncharacterized protein with GYD domain
MPTYVSLVDWTAAGIEDVAESPDRLDNARDVFDAHGGEITDFFMTMGQYDMTVVSELPDDASCAKAMLELGRSGSIRTETMKAFTEDEYRDICASL